MDHGTAVARGNLLPAGRAFSGSGCTCGGSSPLQEPGRGTDTPRDMALADWLLPLLLLVSEEEDGHSAFDWTAFDPAPVTSPDPDTTHPV